MLDPMISFDDFLTAAPDIAGPVLDRLTSTGIGLLGTVRRDGSPRVSPVEVGLHDGRLALGMMPGSAKLADVRRDPRACLLTPVADRTATGGEGKLFGRIEEVRGGDADRLLRARVDRLDGVELEDLAASPVFELRIGAAAWQHVDGDAWDTRSWSVGSPVRHRRREGATGEAVDVGDDRAEGGR